jgi:predicted AAA+ superfamily ATPase
MKSVLCPLYKDMHRLDDLIADAQTRAIPSLTLRDLSLAASPGQARALIGMRRVGKTFACFQEIDRLLRSGIDRGRILYLNLEDDRLGTPTSDLLGTVLETFYRMSPAARTDGAFLFLDEIQAVPEWARFARRVLDTERVRLHITGSSAKMLSTDVATEFRGRGLAIDVWPFSFAEYARHLGELSADTRHPGAVDRSKLEALFLRYLRTGGFPAVAAMDDRERVQTLQDYVDLVVVRDTVERHRLTNITAVRAFLLTLVQSTGRLFTVNKTYRDLKSRGVDVGKDLLHALLGHASDARLTFTVARFSRSVRDRAVRPRKIYAIDPGLASAVSLATTRDTGARLETAVYLELRRRLGRARDGALSYYVTQGGHEIDFVIGDSGEGEATAIVQVCADLSDPGTRERELRALGEAMKELRRSTATLVSLHDTGEAQLPGGLVRIVPAWRWALDRGEEPLRQ